MSPDIGNRTHRRRSSGLNLRQGLERTRIDGLRDLLIEFRNSPLLVFITRPASQCDEVDA
jgi:hypothetical protein